MLSLTNLQPLFTFAATLDLQDPQAARQALEKEFPLQGEAMQALRADLVKQLEAGTICHRGEDPLRFSRVAKPCPETLQFSVDTVLMNGAGPRHCHPRGEIDLCFALDGQPSFDGNPEGWTVYGEESIHVPTVRGGTMLILYLLPDGALEFLS